MNAGLVLVLVHIPFLQDENVSQGLSGYGILDHDTSIRLTVLVLLVR